MWFLGNVFLLFLFIFVSFIVLMGRRRRSGYDCSTDDVISYSSIIGLFVWVAFNIIIFCNG